MKIGEYELVRTCEACPEQYEVYLGAKEVGYLRLRHGFFYASVPDCVGTRVYESRPKGDGYFAYDERQRELTAAVAAIDKHLKESQ